MNTAYHVFKWHRMKKTARDWSRTLSNSSPCSFRLNILPYGTVPAKVPQQPSVPPHRHMTQGKPGRSERLTRRAAVSLQQQKIGCPAAAGRRSCQHTVGRTRFPLTSASAFVTPSSNHLTSHCTRKECKMSTVSSNIFPLRVSGPRLCTE